MINVILKNVYCQLSKVLLKKKGCKFENNVSFDNQCSFEGHNFLSSGCYLRCVKLGEYSYVGNDGYLIATSIGKYTSIGPRVTTAIGRHPTHTYVSTHPQFCSPNPPSRDPFIKDNSFKEIELVQTKDSNNKYAIRIGNDVWIGANVTIVDGVTIGDGAVIGAGAVVLHDVPSYAVVVGVPARVIRKRFSEEQISSLLKFEWWDKDREWLKSKSQLFSDIVNFKEELKI